MLRARLSRGMLTNPITLGLGAAEVCMLALCVGRKTQGASICRGADGHRSLRLGPIASGHLNLVRRSVCYGTPGRWMNRSSPGEIGASGSRVKSARQSTRMNATCGPLQHPASLHVLAFDVRPQSRPRLQARRAEHGSSEGEKIMEPKLGFRVIRWQLQQPFAARARPPVWHGCSRGTWGPPRGIAVQTSSPHTLPKRNTK